RDATAAEPGARRGAPSRPARRRARPHGGDRRAHRGVCAPMTEHLRVDHDGGVLRLTLDRTEKRNALDDGMMAGLISALDGADTDESVRVVVLDGAGDHFCGGADIVARNADRDARPRTGSIQRRLPQQAHRLIPTMLRVQTPIVCAVRGWAAGIGFQLALASDFTVAADDATFWEPFSE